MINNEIDRLRLATTSALLSGRRDVVVVSSVSCLYGMGNPEDFNENVVTVRKGMKISRNAFLRKLVNALYSRNEVNFDRGNFRVKATMIAGFWGMNMPVPGQDGYAFYQTGWFWPCAA